ncbi:MAG: SDR family oxidoreductase [Cytophagaceae bacterium]|jgi:NAD(P)-dependent dehydrogenase (short-subunit alcohol dehydrogenase family)|nr:SDR family oxidoreductase [Cytophagaceae bacterium]
MNYLFIGNSSAIASSVQKHIDSSSHNLWTVGRSTSDIASAHHHTWSSVEDPLPTDFLPDTLHGFVYFPGTINLKPFHRTSEEDFLSDYKVNVLGAVRSLQWAMGSLKKGNGSVVLISSVAATTGMGFHSSIASAKSALEGLARSLAAEWAPHIRVNAVAPSLTDTPLAEKFLSSEDKRQASIKRHPLSKIGAPDDIASAINFLLQPSSAWMTGQVIAVDGGLSSLRLL